jgi:hypothetical protein
MSISKVQYGEHKPILTQSRKVAEKIAPVRLCDEIIEQLQLLSPRVAVVIKKMVEPFI